MSDVEVYKGFNHGLGEIEWLECSEDNEAIVNRLLASMGIAP